jgi:cobalt/nickel transport system permease protein
VSQKAYEVFDETTYGGYHGGSARQENHKPGEVRSMHIPDGLLDPTVAAATGALGAAGLLYAVRRLERQLGDRTTVLMGTMSAFVFAAQMVNFPVASGTSGHLIGGVLAAVLLGPWLGVIVVSVVLVVQCLLFADGGLTALGLNVVNMAIVPALGGYAIFAALRSVLPRRPSSVTVASGLAAFASVPVAAATFTLEYALGGDGIAPIPTVLAAMVGVHVVIGVGEGILTALVISAVLAVRPDLVTGARPARPLVRRDAEVAGGVPGGGVT